MRRQPIILAGGCCLAFGAAFANTGLLFRTGTSVSHLTGDLSKLSIDLVRASPEVFSELLRVGAAAFAFLFGAVFSGLVIHHPTLDFARPYGRTVTGIGLLFVVAHFLIPTSPVAAISLSAFGCGIQNSLANQYRGIILRTTHLTGLVTDLGIALGMRAKGFEVPIWRATVPALLIVSFVLGGVVATSFIFFTALDAVFVAGIAYIAAGLIWTVVKHLILQKRSAAGSGERSGPDTGPSDREEEDGI